MEEWEEGRAPSAAQNGENLTWGVWEGAAGTKGLELFAAQTLNTARWIRRSSSRRLAALSCGCEAAEACF